MVSLISPKFHPDKTLIKKGPLKKKDKLKIVMVGVFKDESSSNVYFANGLEKLDAVEKVTRFDYRDQLFRNRNAVPMLLNEQALRNDIMIICKGNGIRPDVIRECSDKCKTFLWFMDWYPQLQRCKDTFESSMYCHFRSATGYETAKLWSERSMLPVYHILDGCSEEIFFKEQDIRKEFDVSFIGGFDEERHVIRDSISKECRTSFFGPGFTDFVMPKQFRHICNKSRICLNISRGNYEGYSSLRLWSLLGCGSLVLTKKIPGMTERMGLVAGTHLDEFENIMQLKEKVRYYLSNPDIREEIALNGHQYTVNNRTWKNAASELLSVVLNSNSNFRRNASQYIY